MKVAPDRPGAEIDPDDLERLPDPAMEALAREYAARRFPSLADAPIVGARVCQYDLTAGHALPRRPPSGEPELVARGRRLRPRLQARPGARRVHRRLRRGPARPRSRFTASGRAKVSGPAHSGGVRYRRAGRGPSGPLLRPEIRNVLCLRRASRRPGSRRSRAPRPPARRSRPSGRPRERPGSQSPARQRRRSSSSLNSSLPATTK